MKRIILTLILIGFSVVCYSQTHTMYISKMLKRSGQNLKCDDNPGYVRFIKVGDDKYLVEFRTKLIEQDMLFYDQGGGHLATLEKQDDGSVVRYDMLITEVQNVPSIYVTVFNVEYLFRIERIDN